MKLYICENVKNAKWRKNIVNDKKLSLAFVKNCICDFIDEKENAVEIAFSKNEYGKPYVESIYKIIDKSGENKIKIDIPLFFSLSHSGNMMICAVACFNIGADCQIIDTENTEKYIKIAKRFYSERENIFLSSILHSEDFESDADEKEFRYINNFFKIWTKKEAYVKYTGKGLSEGLNTFSVTSGQRQKNYCGDVYFRRIYLSKSKKTYKNKFYIYLCYNKDNKNILGIKYVY